MNSTTLANTATYIGIAEMEVSEDPSAVLTASNLGSCLGIAVYDPVRSIGGMIHCLLPLSKSDPDKAREKPYMYVDTGVAALLDQLLQRGCKKQNLEIYVAGGAEMTETTNLLQIGKKNITVLRKILWKNDLLIKNQDVGGHCSRTITLHIGTGEILLRMNGQEQTLR